MLFLKGDNARQYFNIDSTPRYQDKIITQNSEVMITSRINQFLIAATLIFLGSLSISAQPNSLVHYEGIFMNDFKVIVSISDSREGFPKGKIEMYAGNNQIQNDNLTNIRIDDGEISFLIPAKDTRFNGFISAEQTDIKGEFIFPDGSKHPLEVTKVEKKDPGENLTTFRNKMLTPTQMRQDYLMLFNALKENHPNLYQYTTPSEFEKITTKIENDITLELSVLDFYYELSMLTNAIQCSHTGVRLPQNYRMAMESEGSTFPLKLYFLDSKAYVIDAGSSEINLGSEITRINNRSTEEIINKLSTLIPANGTISSTKYFVLNSSFQRLYPIIDQESKYVVEYRLDGILKTMQLPGMPISALNGSTPMHEQDVISQFEYLNQSTAYLKISSFAIRDMDSYFAELDDFFKYSHNKKVNNLILDLRGNAGGHPIFAAQLMSYLTDKEFVYFKRNEEIKDFEPLYNTMLPNELHFKGNLLVLVNGGCLSTTGHLISLLKYHTNAVFIGDKPGSTYRCNDFSEKITLPNSGLEVNIPRTVFETVVTGIASKEPLDVDYKPEKDINDVIAGSDLEMQIAIKLCESNN